MSELPGTPGDSREIVSFQRRPDFPGVEVRTVEASSAVWCCYSAEFEFASSTSWRGEVWHRRRRERLEPGLVLCSHPGDVCLAVRVETPGFRRSLIIEAKVLGDYLAEHGLCHESLSLRAVSPLSDAFGAHLALMYRLLLPGASTLLEVQCGLVGFVAAMVDALVDRGAPRRGGAWSDRAARRVRDCLHDDRTANLDLATVAVQAGLSRYQALRAFKRRYGLPPHAYQLRARVGMAQRSLRAGEPASHVAAACGFTDQSHMTRHFKRLVGVTPAQYQRAGVAGAR